ncbi:MAG TPA: GIY-YIG nuclease family protein [Ignavibacteria bacterium]|jgi:putative endonuclease
MTNFYVYVLASKKHGMLYSAFTNNIIRSVYEHRNGLLSGITKKHSIKKLVYWAKFENIDNAIEWDMFFKSMKKNDKLKWIDENNPFWKDLYYELGGDDKYEFYDEQIKKYRREYTYK